MGSGCEPGPSSVSAYEVQGKVLLPDGKSGAASGEHLVRIESTESTPMTANKQGKAQLPFPYKDTDEASSGLVAKLEARSNPLEPFLRK